MAATMDEAMATTSYDEAFDGLFAVAYRVAYRILGSREEADDVASETMAKAWARWPRVAPFAAAWVARVGANGALSAQRRRRVRNKSPRPTGRAPSSVDGLRVDLVRALRKLSRRQREVVVLRYLADLPEEAVAAALGCTVGTVKQHAHRGLKALQADVGLAEGGE